MYLKISFGQKTAKTLFLIKLMFTDNIVLMSTDIQEENLKGNLTNYDKATAQKILL